MNPKLLTLIGGIGGGCGLTSLIYWKANNPEPTKLQISSQTLPSVAEALPETDMKDQVSLSRPKDINEGNCEVIKHLEPDLFFDLWQEKNSYFAISCKNVTGQEPNKKIKNDWIGLFPNTLLVNRDTLTEGKRINMDTQTLPLETENYKTVFSGERLTNSSVTGEWKNEPQFIGDKYVITVNVSGGLSNSHPIFLVFDTPSPFDD